MDPIEYKDVTKAFTEWLQAYAEPEGSQSRDYRLADWALYWGPRFILYIEKLKKGDAV
jgi:hypothetical protein